MTGGKNNHSGGVVGVGGNSALAQLILLSHQYLKQHVHTEAARELF